MFIYSLKLILYSTFLFEKKKNLLKGGSRYISSEFIKFFDNKNFENFTVLEYFLFTDHLVLAHNENSEEGKVLFANPLTERSKNKASTGPIIENNSKASNETMQEETPIQKNNILEIKPWLNIVKIPPSIPYTLFENKPITTKFIWAIEEYAIIFFKSICCNIIIDIKITEIKLKVITNGV